jgi:hypothetical protein
MGTGIPISDMYSKHTEGAPPPRGGYTPSFYTTDHSALSSSKPEVLFFIFVNLNQFSVANIVVVINYANIKKTLGKQTHVIKQSQFSFNVEQFLGPDCTL